MATPTYTLLDSVTLTSSASSVTFSNIDQSFGDLVVVSNVLSNSNYRIQATFNNDSTNHYKDVVTGGGGGGFIFNGATTEPYFDIANAGTSSTASISICQIMDYTATDKHKTMLTRINASNTVMYAQRWPNTSAITEIDIVIPTSSMFAGSTFYLYGIEA